MTDDSDALDFDPAPLDAALRSLDDLARRFGETMTRAFARAGVEGKRLDETLKGLALSLSGQALRAALAPIEKGVGNLFGAAFSGLATGSVTPFADGGVLARPTYFPLAGGLGLAGEAGPEAILPLRRGADGRLGVAAEGGGGRAPVTITIHARDADSFRRSEGEVAALIARAVARGERGL